MNIGNILKLVSPAKKTCIQAGHFAVITNKEKTEVFPAVWEDLIDELQSTVLSHPYMGIFPGETWKACAQIITELPSAQVALLVNDWQFLRQTEQEENPYRKLFYESQKTIPPSFMKEIEKTGKYISEVLVSPGRYGSRSNTLFFSEVRLRNHFKRKLNNKCSLQHGCAQEYLPFLLYLHELGFESIINLIPTTCMGPILESTAVAQNEYGMESVEMISVFANGADSANDFWKNAICYKNGDRVRI